MRSAIRLPWLVGRATAGIGAVASAAAMPATAGAFATPPCMGAQAAGVGDSLQGDAQLGNSPGTGWAYTFANDPNSVCGSPFDPAPTYTPLGSSDGPNAMCAGGNLDFSTDFAGTDEPPTAAQVAAMNNCPTAVNPPLAIHTIPVAQAAIAIAVNLPTGCTINQLDQGPTGDRFAILDANLEAAFFNGGSAPTWSTLLPNSPTCTGPVIRVAPYDQSGQTFQTMNYLAQINSADQSTWGAAATAFQPGNWPNNASNIVYGGTTSGDSAPAVCLGGLTGAPAVPPQTETQAEIADCNGAAHVAQAVEDTPGSIGYADLGTLRANGFQYTPGQSFFWVPVQNNGTGTKGATFADPNANANGYMSPNPTGGANCDSASYTPPGGFDPTLSNWDGVIGSSPDTATYPLCMLVYDLAWDDPSAAYGNTPAIDARQRTVKDYLTYMTSNVLPTDGQSILRSLDYDTVPTPILPLSQEGVASIHFPPPGGAPVRYLDQVFSNDTVTTGIQYGSAPDEDGNPQALTLDLYQPAGDTATNRPAIVWVHGGAFTNGSSQDGDMVTLSNEFAELGYVAVSINYRLLHSSDCFDGNPSDCVSEATFAQNDAQAAVRWLRANATSLGINPDEIAIGGESAGGMAALLVGMRPDDPGDSGNPGYSSAVQGVVSISGGVPDNEFVNPNDAPALLFAGMNDPLVPYAWPASNASAMLDQGVIANLVPNLTGGHVDFNQNASLYETDSPDFLYDVLGLANIPPAGTKG